MVHSNWYSISINASCVSVNSIESFINILSCSPTWWSQWYFRHNVCASLYSTHLGCVKIYPTLLPTCECWLLSDSFVFVVIRPTFDIALVNLPFLSILSIRPVFCKKPKPVLRPPYTFLAMLMTLGAYLVTKPAALLTPLARPPKNPLFPANLPAQLPTLLTKLIHPIYWW